MFCVVFGASVSNLPQRIDIPVTIYAHMVGTDEKTMGRRQANDIAEQRLLIMHNRIGEVFTDHPFVWNRADDIVFKERPEFRGPEQSAVVSTVIEWSGPKNIPGAE